MHFIFVFLGAGLGGVLRYSIANSIHQWLGRDFPYGTIFVNVSGCFLMGFLFMFLLNKFDGGSQSLRSLLLIGLLGGYTTFSTFSIETIHLFENGAWGSAVLNIIISITLCIVATWFGVIGGKYL